MLIFVRVGGAVVEISVGEGGDARSFWIYKDLICFRSPFFENALSHNWKESEDNVIRLPEDEPEIFDLYVQVLFTGKIPVGEVMSIDESEKDEANSEDEAVKQASLEYIRLGKLYVFAEKLQDVTTKNLTVTAFVEALSLRRLGMRHFPNSDVITLIYNGTPKPCPIRELLVDIYAIYAVPSWWGKDVAEDYPKDFLFDTMRRLTEDREGSVDSSKITKATNYHEETIEYKSSTVEKADV